MSVKMIVDVDIDDYAYLLDIELKDGDEDLVDFTCNTDGGITILIDGYVIDEKQWNLLQALELIEPE